MGKIKGDKGKKGINERSYEGNNSSLNLNMPFPLLEITYYQGNTLTK
jgi:hypothetical protein